MKRISSSGNMILFTATALVVIIGMVWGLLVFSVPTINDEATSKATELAGAMQDAGLGTPSVDVLAGMFGTDGGLMCQDPGAALAKATRNLTLVNGAAHTGVRPIVAASQVVRGEELALSVYCPDQLPAFRDYVNELKFAVSSLVQ